MGLGIIEPHVAEDRLVPGTVHLYDAGEAGAASSQQLKHGAAGLVLSPQPTASPNDPLNWPIWRKHAALFFIAFINGLNESMTILVSPVTGIIVEEFHITFEQAGQLVGVPLLTLGFGGLVYVPFARWFGRRPVYLFGVLVLFATTIWIIYAKTYHSLLAARAVNGFGNAAFNSMSVASIGDMYFVHERGTKVQFLYMMNIACLMTAPILGGWIAFKHNWQLLYKIGAGLYGLMLLAVIFFIPESTYIRPVAFETDVASEKDLMLNTAATEVDTKGEVTTSAAERASPSHSFDEPPRTFVQNLAPWTGRIYYRENPLRLVARAFVCIFFPTVISAAIAVCVYGLFAVGATVTMAQIFSVPPALFDAAQLGFTYTFPAVGAVLGFILGALLSDPILKWAARRNGGTAEPEFRFFQTIPMYSIGIIGFFLFGWYASRADAKWVPASAVLGLVYFGYQIASSVSYGYVLDCHRNYAAEVTVALTIIRSSLSYAGTYFLPTWLARSGTKHVYYSTGGIEVAMFALTVLAYVCGKQIREFTHRYNLIQMLRL